MSLNVVASPAITLVSGKASDPSAKKKEVATGDILNGVKGRVDEDGNLIVDDTIGKEAGGNTKTPPRFTGTELSRQRTQDLGVANGLFDKNTGVAGGPSVGPGALVDRSSTALPNPDPSGFGDGRGVAGFAEEKGLLPSLLAAQGFSAFGGPGAFGGGGGLGDMFAGMNGLGGKAPPKNPVTPPSPERQRTPTPGPKDPIAKDINQPKLDQSIADGELLEKYKGLGFDKDTKKLNNTGKEKLEERFATNPNGVTTSPVVQEAFNTFKTQMDNANNDTDRKKAINTFRDTLKTQGFDSEAIFKTLFNEPDVAPPQTPEQDKA